MRLGEVANNLNKIYTTQNRRTMDLKNTKVYVDGRSAEIQKKAFELGFGEDIVPDKYPFLYFNQSMFIGCGSDMKHFKEHEFEEISADEILTIKVEPKFKPFDRVLVRAEGDWDWVCGRWEAALYSHFKDGLYYANGTYYKYCIPYEGNEHLIGTKNEPE